MVQHPIIRLTPVEEDQARQFASLHSRPHCGIQSKEGICSTVPPAEATLVIIKLIMRVHLLQDQGVKSLVTVGKSVRPRYLEKSVRSPDLGTETRISSGQPCGMHSRSCMRLQRSKKSSLP
jgi:hypothetical protein